MTEQHRRVLALLPSVAREHLEGFLRAARNPEALLAELEGIPQGLYGQPYDWHTIGRALCELALAGKPATAKLLSAFCRDVVERSIPPAEKSRQAESDWVKRKNEQLAKERAGAR